MKCMSNVELHFGNAFSLYKEFLVFCDKLMQMLNPTLTEKDIRAKNIPNLILFFFLFKKPTHSTCILLNG